MDISYLNIAGTFYFLCSVLDGYSRFIVHWEIREKMEEIDVETILQRAREKFPGATPTHHHRQRTAVHRQGLQGIHPHRRHDPCPYLSLLPAVQRQDRTLAQNPQGRLHPRQSAAVAEDARHIVADYVHHYNEVRLHSAVGYVTPNDRSLGNDEAIHAERDRKLAEARERRKQMRQTRHEQSRAQPDASRPAIDFAAVRAAITIAQVLALLGFTPRSDHAGQQRGALSPARLHARHRPLLQRQHQLPHVPLLQVQSIRQRSGLVGRRQPPVDLRRRHRPVPAFEHPLANLLAPPPTANREEETVATASSTCTIP